MVQYPEAGDGGEQGDEEDGFGERECEPQRGDGGDEAAAGRSVVPSAGGARGDRDAGRCPGWTVFRARRRRTTARISAAVLRRRNLIRFLETSAPNQRAPHPSNRADTRRDLFQPEVALREMGTPSLLVALDYLALLAGGAHEGVGAGGVAPRPHACTQSTQMSGDPVRIETPSTRSPTRATGLHAVLAFNPTSAPRDMSRDIESMDGRSGKAGAGDPNACPGNDADTRPCRPDGTERTRLRPDGPPARTCPPPTGVRVVPGGLQEYALMLLRLTVDADEAFFTGRRSTCPKP